MTAEYYAVLHATSRGYQENNWLLPELDRALACKPTSMLEIGFGNGRFLVEAAKRVDHVIGIDWAASPIATDMPANVEIVIADATKEALPSVDLACSSDVLEHFSPADIDRVLANLHQAGRYNFHVIACYDDGHSHLSIFPPEVWLEKFRAVSLSYRLVEVRTRPGKTQKTTCVIANY